MKEDYSHCWYCEDIVGHYGQLGLLYLKRPRCFVLIDDVAEFGFYDFDEFVSNAHVNWLDPSDKGTPEELEEILIDLWNFSRLEEGDI